MITQNVLELPSTAMLAPCTMASAELLALIAPCGSRRVSLLGKTAVSLVPLARQTPLEEMLPASTENKPAAH